MLRSSRQCCKRTIPQFHKIPSWWNKGSPRRNKQTRSYILPFRLQLCLTQDHLSFILPFFTLDLPNLWSNITAKTSSFTTGTSLIEINHRRPRDQKSKPLYTFSSHEGGTTRVYYVYMQFSMVKGYFTESHLFNPQKTRKTSLAVKNQYLGLIPRLLYKLTWIVDPRYLRHHKESSPKNRSVQHIDTEPLEIDQQALLALYFSVGNVFFRPDNTMAENWLFPKTSRLC